jgi:hypothetical protein
MQINSKPVIFLTQAPLCDFHPHMTHSQLLKGPKCGPKWKTLEKEGIGAHSLAHNTLRGRGVCWSFGMRLGIVDKLRSLTRACTQPPQSG